MIVYKGYHSQGSAQEKIWSEPGTHWNPLFWFRPGTRNPSEPTFWVPTRDPEPTGTHYLSKSRNPEPKGTQIL